MSSTSPATCTYVISDELARYISTKDRDLLRIDIPIPLPEFSDVDEYMAIFGQRGLLETVNEVELREEMERFIHDETQRIQDERNDALIRKALERRYELPDSEPTPHVVADQSEAFANNFSYVMRNSPSVELAELMRRQIAMMNEMSQIIRVRNWEVTQLTNKCENAMKEATTNADIHPHELSNLNEKLRNLHISYACQVEDLSEKQRKEFSGKFPAVLEENAEQRLVLQQMHELAGLVKDMVDILCSGKSLLTNSESREDTVELRSSATKAASETGEEYGINECYTIYIGAQLKSMHNVRLLTAKSMVDLCTPTKGTDIGSLLQMSISLYGRQLSALIMLVPRDPLYHSTLESKFAQICENTTELHFDPLPKQLKEVLTSTAKANQWREESASERSKSTELRKNPKPKTHETILEPGDVYCTRHSNLKNVQLVFHLVADESLLSSDISSRNPCLNGIRNVIRLTSRLGITSLYIPLLLAEEASENMTIPWCMRRAEMVYKCVKGYLMEVCGVCGGSAVGDGVTNVPHYNIYFVLPSGLAEGVYQQISAMFPTIFHLVPSVSMSVQGFD